MRIANNVSALNSWRQLTKNQKSVDASLEKLSSGFRINRAGDDPAGLVLSEKLRAQITGLKQAVKNTQDAASMMQTAEGSMQEMHSILNEIRSLVLHAKNSGAVDSTSIAADQSQVDEAISALDKIANNTLFGGKNLLNGSLTNKGTVLNSTAVNNVTVGTTAPSGTNLVEFVVSTIASRAIVTSKADISAGVASAGNISVNGVAISLAIASQDATVAALNSAFSSNGLDLTATKAGTTITINHNQYGLAHSVSVLDTGQILMGSATLVTDAGSDIVGTINGQAATGSGLTLTANAGTAYAGTAVTVTAGGGNATATYANAFSVTSGGLTFQVGSEASDTVSTAITDVRAAALGGTAGGATGLSSIRTGGAYALATNPTTALAVIDEAIADVSTARAQLGAIQKYTLETKINSLNVALENVTASESRIRDVDMAAEMATFTKNQVLVQSATAMLAQANAQPQSILSLLQ